MKNKGTFRLIQAFLVCCGTATALTSCKHVDEEPALNLGYETNIRVPDAENMTAADSAYVTAQQAEYELNAK